MRLARLIAAMTTGALALGLAACSPASDSRATTSSSSSVSAAGTEPADTFPVTIKHALGSTRVEKKPVRVATVSWANHEVPLALGVVPVGMSKATWGDDDGDGMLPWVKDRLDELKADPPVLFDETDGIPFEQVAATKPDVILAAYSGLTQEDYATLSKIAPTIAYPDVPWGTSWKDMTTLNAQALGMEAEARSLVETLQTKVRASMDAHSQLKGKKVLFSSHSASDLSKIGFYSDKDPRPGFLRDSGMALPSIVVSESATSDSFWIEVSAEKAELFHDVDLIVTYGPDDPAPLLKAMQANPLMAQIPAVKQGHIVFLGNTPLAASANPSPLSIPWGLDRYLAKLAEGLS